MSGQSSERAQFLDGEPVNLAAAAMDALEWLYFLRGLMNERLRHTRFDDARARLGRAIKALEREIAPCQPAEHFKRREYPEAAIEQHYNKARELALAEVEKMAREILRRHKSFGEFVIGMGRWFFTDKNGDEVIYDPFPEAGSLVDFISEWDKYLKLTGEPMRFTATGETVREW